VSKHRILGLIPAKGGSVRVARKNLRLLGGKPLLQWAIESARGVGLDRVVVSTEDAEAAKVARACGADVPFTRPEHLARDPYGVVDVCLHALDTLEAQGDAFSHLVILLPTSPFRRAQHVREAMERFHASGAAFLMSVTQLDSSLLAAHVARDGFMEPLHPEWLDRLGARAKKEDLPVLVKANGAVVITDVQRLRKERNYYVYPLAYYSMPSSASLDIDTEDDLKYAEFLLESGRVQATA
jgi:CMP-N-acetylneuraminic acid synthetase